MYLRNVKQILRAGNFDERKYGFGGLMDLLRACQREGSSASSAIAAAACGCSRARRSRGPARRRLSRLPDHDGAELGTETQLEEIEAVEVLVSPEPLDEPDIIEVQPVAVVDTTAELLGRAKARPRRARASSSVVATAAAATRTARPGPRKAAPEIGGGRRPPWSEEERGGLALLEELHPLSHERGLRSLGLERRRRRGCARADVFGA